MAGRMGSTRPMPMKANTAASAVAHTAFGCLRNEAFSACKVFSGAGRVSASWPSMEGAPKFVTGSVLEGSVDFVDDRQRVRQRFAVLVAEGTQDACHHLVAAPVCGVHGVPAFGGQDHPDGAGVVRVRLAACESGTFELDDLL